MENEMDERGGLRLRGIGAEETFGGLILRHGGSEGIGSADQADSLLRGELRDMLKGIQQRAVVARGAEEAVFPVTDQAVKALAAAVLALCRPMRV